MKLLMQNNNPETVPEWQRREFWNYGVHPITGKKETLKTNRSSKHDATVQRIAETNNQFVSMHV